MRRTWLLNRALGNRNVLRSPDGLGIYRSRGQRGLDRPLALLPLGFALLFLLLLLALLLYLLHLALLRFT